LAKRAASGVPATSATASRPLSDKTITAAGPASVRGSAAFAPSRVLAAMAPGLRGAHFRTRLKLPRTRQEQIIMRRSLAMLFAMLVSAVSISAFACPADKAKMGTSADGQQSTPTQPAQPKS
jgi:hypothetical protein